ncbi:MFS transporter [Actinophytocola xanthii]|uniref:MFS transporter n=1 Tax=Actinophytocola xanthii TaxID=1912961 RepID=A0A1Q8CV53_9PSEU|nr:MFS transporter [Actinophytocola xanthii]OLF18216.1 MFS transporter [Actinophytocola xanthii]
MTRTDPTTNRLVLSPLLALATAVFITSLTETLPAGVLVGMSDGLGVSDSTMGQAVTVYAVGTALTAVPLSAATAHWRRKRLLLTAMAGFLAANTLTALAPTYAVVMIARFLAGAAAGVAWSMLAGYARRLAPPRLAGRATAVAMTGVPLALSLGVPAGTFLGHVLDWRAAFGAMSLLTIGVLTWIAVGVADFPGVARTRGDRRSILVALAVPGVPAVLAVTLVFVLAHTIIYTFVATYLADAGMADRTDLVLLVFGIACLVSIWLVGKRVDRDLRRLTIASIGLVAAAAMVFAVTRSPFAVYVAAAAWGLGWGGVPTLLQTAGAVAGGRHSEAAADGTQSMLVTLWNAAMAFGGSAGGLVLAVGGVVALPAATALMSLPALLIVVAARRHAFP